MYYNCLRIQRDADHSEDATSGDVIGVSSRMVTNIPC